MEKIMISGFSDEISSDFDEQLRVVTGLGMEYISLRTADGKSIADYSAKEVKEKLLPKLKDAGVRVSSLGSPIGKVEIGDEEGIAKQLVQLEELCKGTGLSLHSHFQFLYSGGTESGGLPGSSDRKADKV